jgi:hypothetical protein
VTIAANGTYQLVLFPGSHTVVVDADGYAPLVETFTVTGEQHRDFRLAPASRLRGRVVTGDGRGVAGAAVVVQEERVLRPARRETRTDESGVFAVVNLAPGAYTVLARRGALVGRHPARVGVEPGATVEIEILAREGLMAAGVVRDRAGPVAAAQIRVAGGPASLSGADGHFRLEGLLPGSVRLLAEAPAHGPAAIDLALSGDRSDLTIELPVGARVQGVVRSAAGVPVAGAEVAALVTGQEGSSAVARSDGEGRFVLAELGPGQLRVEAVHPLGRGLTGPLPLAAGEALTVDVRLGSGARVRGTVRFDDGAPAPGVRVFAGRPQRETFTDPGGRYELGPLEPGALAVTAVPDPDPLGYGKGGPNVARVVLEANEVKDVDLSLPRTDGRIDGVVLDPDGDPLPGAVVGVSTRYQGASIRPFNRYVIDLPESGSYRVLSDGDGRFALRGLYRLPVTVWAEHPAYPEADVDDVAPGSAGVVVRFAPGAALAGRVVAGRAAVTDYELSVVLSDRTPPGTPAAAARGYVQRTLTVHDPGGAFAVDRLHAALYDLVAVTPDGRVGRLAAVGLEAGRSVADLTVEVGPTATVVGRVVDGRGQPVPGASVSAWVTMLVRKVAATSDGSGAFRLSGVPSGGPATLLVRAEPRLTGRRVIEVPAGGGEIDAGEVLAHPAQ